MNSITDAINPYQTGAVFEVLAQFTPSDTPETCVRGLKLELSSADDIACLHAEDSNITGKDGNYYVNVLGKNNEINLGDGKSKVKTEGSKNKTSVGNGANNILIGGYRNTLTVGSGANTVRAYGNGNNITLGSGKNDVGILGENVTVNEAANSKITKFLNCYHNQAIAKRALNTTDYVFLSAIYAHTKIRWAADYK